MQACKRLVRKLLLLTALLSTGHALAASLEPAMLPKVQAATFEVVLPKPDESTITYDKPLPLDQLPFQFRNDKYYSIGTAFALGNDRYVTAFHVISAGLGSLLGAPALRDAQGHVYAIDKITRFSLQEDFVEFTLVGQPKVTPLQVNRTPAINDVVYAVGNALGTGVVIRDGLYTSDTPEEQDGRWKWMRFSAAASPGNSGGPLLDKTGKIIGIVLMKSESENLNYALPIGRVLDASTDTAQIDQRMNYVLDIMDDTQTGFFRGSFSLPRDYADFAAEYQRQRNAYMAGQLKALLAKNADNLFPRGNDSHRLLAATAGMDEYPSLIHRATGGTWGMYQPKAGRDPLPANGYVERGAAGMDLLFHVRKPDNVPLATLYGDSQMLMDLILKAAPLTREMGNEKVKVLSVGKPIREEIHVDRYQRRWQMRMYAMPYANNVMITYALPVPDGYVAIMRYVSSGSRYEHILDLEAICDYVNVAYDGTFAQWQEFMQNGALLPKALGEIKLSIAYGKHFDFSSPQFRLGYGPELQKIDAGSELTLGFVFVPEGDGVRWQIGGLIAKADSDKKEKLRINRHVKPFDDLEQSYHSIWNGLLKRDHPQDSQPYNDNDNMYIGTVAGSAATTSVQAKPNLVYTAFYGADGSKPAATMRQKLALLLKGLSIDEH